MGSEMCIRDSFTILLIEFFFSFQALIVRLAFSIVLGKLENMFKVIINTVNLYQLKQTYIFARIYIHLLEKRATTLVPLGTVTSSAESMPQWHVD